MSSLSGCLKNFFVEKILAEITIISPFFCGNSEKWNKIFKRL